MCSSLKISSALVALLFACDRALAQDSQKPAAKAKAEAKPVDTNWPQFRGHAASGVATGFPMPSKWDVEKGENIRFKIKVPGLAHSSPIIWGDRIYLTTAVRDGEAELKVGLYGSIAPVEDDSEHEMRLICLDKKTGEEIWSRTACKAVPKIKRHPKGSHAACTPATDGRHVIAHFASEGVYCYSAKDGRKLWKKDLGRLDSGYFRVKSAQWGFASSPVIHEGRVYLQCDIQDQSFVCALDVTSGDEIWRTNREEVPTWSTPTVHIGKKRRQLICNGWKRMASYDLDSGKELWWSQGGGDIPVPTPVIGHGLVYLTSAHGRAAPILAFSLDAEGELPLVADDSEHVAWSYPRRFGNYMQTPIVYGDLIYFCHDRGTLSCYDARSGEQKYRQRLNRGGTPTGWTGSGVAADGKLYFTNEVGECVVIKAGAEYEQLAMNPLGEEFMSSPAISGDTIYFRTRRHLIAVAQTAKASKSDKVDKKKDD